MYVIKRNGRKEKLNIQQIRKQTREAVAGLNNVNMEELELDAGISFQDGIKTEHIQQMLIKTAINKISVDRPDWTYVAQRLKLYDLYHRVKKFYNVRDGGNIYKVITLKDYIKNNLNILSDWTTKYNDEEIDYLDSFIKRDRDLLYDYPGFEIAIDMYLLKNNAQPCELPQHMHMAIAMFAMQNEPRVKRISYVLDYYDAISKLEYVNATPINANARSKSGSLISCLINTVDDTTDSIMEKISELAHGSRLGSGFGVDITRIRSIGSNISINNNAAGGKIPFVKIMNEVARAFNQNGKRPGAFAVYTECWDIEIMEFMELRKTAGEERMRARDIFLAITYNDLFFEREGKNELWTLFDPKDVPLLYETYGDDFKKHYLEYEEEWLKDPSLFNANTKQIPARDIMRKHCITWSETGMPFIFFKDNANRANPYKEYGIIRSSNLCLTGDTLVAVPSTKGMHEIPISELAKGSQGTGTFSVRSAYFDTESNRWKPEITDAVAFSTGVRQIIKLVFNDNTYIKCTPDHPIACVNGEYVEAVESKDKLLESIVINKDTGNIIRVYKQVVDIIMYDEPQEVYDLTVNRNSNFYVVTNTNLFQQECLLVHNCTEIALPTTNDFTAVCNLGSINISKTNTKKDIERVVRICLRALDNFIDLTPYPSEEAKAFQMKFRTTGIGTLGIAEYLAHKQVYYGSEEHKAIERFLWSNIKECIDNTTEQLAKEKGSCVVEGRRNSWTMAIAPNSSSAVFAGTTNGIEPVYDKIWAEENKIGTSIITAPHINIDNIAYYQNPYEIDIFSQIEVNAIRQQYVDQGISFNVFLDPDGLGVKKIRDVIIYAWKHKLKSLYYMRSKPPRLKSKKNNDNEIQCTGCVN